MKEPSEPMKVVLVIVLLALILFVAANASADDALKGARCEFGGDTKHEDYFVPDTHREIAKYVGHMVSIASRHGSDIDPSLASDLLDISCEMAWNVVIKQLEAFKKEVEYSNPRVNFNW